MKPELSVITPAFRAAPYIHDAVASVAAQKGIIEHIVQDNLSGDGSRELAMAASPQILWFEEQDRGQSDALNRSLERATGTWVGWLNADEFYLPAGLDRLVRCANALDLDVVFGEAIFVDASGRFLRALPQHRLSRRVLWWYGMFISSCAILVRAEALRDFSFDESLRRVMDWDMALHLERTGCSFGFLPSPIGAFRVHPAQVTASPATAFSQEYARLGERYSELGRRHRRSGRALHAAMKLQSGGYRRQARCRRCAGMSMRWFDDAVGRSGIDALVDAYGLDHRAGDFG